MKRIVAYTVIAAVALAIPAISEAQLSKLLKKAGKVKEKVEKKVNETVKSINSALEGDNSSRKPDDKTTSEAVSSPADKADDSHSSPMYTTEQLRQMAEQNVAVPHLTRETLFKVSSVSLNGISTPSDGIFSVLEYNREIGYAAYFSFYTVTGEYLFAPEWVSSGEQPRFDSGAAIVKAGKRNSAGKQPLYILYGDGSVRELPVSIKESTQFYDGVAKVSYSEGRKSGVYYINTKGEKIWPSLAMDYSLKSKMDMTIGNGARYLRDGRRAYYDNIKRRWGYLDDKGNVALAPQYVEVRDFSGGYALVIAKGEGKDYPVFIDTSGKEVVKPPIDAPTLQYAQSISDIAEDMFVDYRNATYYDLKGQPVRKYAWATRFFDGYAFTRNSGDECFTAVDSKFVPKRRMSLSYLKRDIVQAFDYSEAGVVTVDEDNVFSASGRHLLSAGNSYPRNGSVGRFSADGYAPFQATLDWNGSHTYVGITDLAGNIVVAFSKDEAAGRGDVTTLPEPIEPVEPGPEPPEPTPIPIPTPIPPVPPYTGGLKVIGGDPKGPKQVNDVTYQVTVKASPAEAANVTGSGRYHYADTVKIGGTVNEGWILTGIDNKDSFTLSGKGSEYVVRGNGEITLLFVKEEETPAAGKGAFEGSLTGMAFNEQLMGIPEMKIYLEMSPDNSYSSPYGENTAGVFTIVNDPETPVKSQLRSMGAPKEGSLVTFNFFPVPMKVLGITRTDDRRQWLVFDGGCHIMAHTRVVSTGAKANDVNAMEALMANLMLMFDNFDAASISPAHYRVEMLDIDPATGEFTFGELQRFSPRGWVPGGDPSIVSYEQGFFITKVDRGLTSDFVKGVRMKPVSGGRQLLWTPPASIYGEPTMAEGVAQSLGQQYREFANQYEIMKGLNVRSINETLDRLFKVR